MVIEKTKKVFLKLDAEGIEKITIEAGVSLAEFQALVERGLESLPFRTFVEFESGETHGFHIAKSMDGIIYIVLMSFVGYVLETGNGYYVYSIPQSVFRGYSIGYVIPILNGEVPELNLTKIIKLLKGV